MVPPRFGRFALLGKSRPVSQLRAQLRSTLRALWATQDSRVFHLRLHPGPLRLRPGPSGLRPGPLRLCPSPLSNSGGWLPFSAQSRRNCCNLRSVHLSEDRPELGHFKFKDANTTNTSLGPTHTTRATFPQLASRNECARAELAHFYDIAWSSIYRYLFVRIEYFGNL